MPIIASTGQSCEQRYGELTSLNISLRLSKPYGARQLLSTVAAAIAGNNATA